MANKYELVTIFKITDQNYEEGIKAVQNVLAEVDANIKSEVDMENRVLAYPIEKQTRGHYRLFNFSSTPERLLELDEKLKLTTQLLRFLVVKKA